MLKKRLKDLNSTKSQGKSIEMINQNDLSKIKGGRKLDCATLEHCGTHSGDCPNLTSCDHNCN